MIYNRQTDIADASEVAIPVALLTAERGTSTGILRAPVIGDGQPSVLADAIADRPALVALSPTVDRLYGPRINQSLKALPVGQCTTYVVPTGEHRKVLSTVAAIVDTAAATGLSRDGIIIGIGGGILLDMVGLAASLFRRGIAHIKVGTTLVAQIDAAVGLKCGVNAGSAKNIAGAFYPPELVLTDGTFLESLSMRDIGCGVAEMIKLAVATDAKLFDWLAEDGKLLLEPDARDSPACRRMIDLSITGMVAELNANPFESDLRRRVDFGHTISGVYEVASGHALRHGEAVALDVALFSALAASLGTLRWEDLDAVLHLFLSLGINVWHPIMDDTRLLEEGLLGATAHRGRRLNLPIPTGIGSTGFIEERTDIPDALLREAVAIVRRVNLERRAEEITG